MLVCLALFGATLLALGAPDILRRRWPALAARWPSPVIASEPLFATSWATCALLLIEPIVWIFYFLLLLVPFAWLLTTLTRTDGGRIRWWLVVGLVGYFIATLVFPLDPRTAAPMSAAYVLGICAHPLGLALVWIALAGYRFSAASRYAPSAASMETNASGTMMPRMTRWLSGK